MFEVD